MRVLRDAKYISVKSGRERVGLRFWWALLTALWSPRARASQICAMKTVWPQFNFICKTQDFSIISCHWANSWTLLFLILFCFAVLLPLKLKSHWSWSWHRDEQLSEQRARKNSWRMRRGYTRIATYPKVAFKLANIAMTTESNPCALGFVDSSRTRHKKVIAWRFEFHKHQQHRFQSETHSRRKKIDFVFCSRIVWHGRQQRLEEEEEIEKRICCCCCLPTSNNQIHVLDGLAEKMNCLNYFFRQLPLLLFLMLMLGYSFFFSVVEFDQS